MTRDIRHAMEQIIAFCNDKWIEADRASPSRFPTADTLTGKKMAYNDVLQYARTVLEEMTAHGSKPDGASSGP
jgi:hypothetical protein